MQALTRGLGIFLLVGASVMMASNALAAAGNLDTTFGGDGMVVTNFTAGEDSPLAVAIQTDHKVVVAGYAAGRGGRFALARYDTNGHLDPTFGGNGRVTTNFTKGFDGAFGVAIDGDGRIVAAGNAGARDSRFALARYRTNGHLDPTFGGDGKVTTNFTAYDDEASDVAIQTDGKIVAAGRAGGCSRFALARYRTNGRLDPTFGGDGKVTTRFDTITTALRSPIRFCRSRSAAASSVAIQLDGKIVAAGEADAGEKFGLARYNLNGHLDSTFGGDGRVRTNFALGDDIASAIALEPDGKIVAAGESRGTRFALARYSTNGRLDSSFGSDGKVTTDFVAGGAAADVASDMAIQSDGKIVAGGDTGTLNPKFALARYQLDGHLDHTFGGDGKVIAVHGSEPGMAIQADGNIVTAGFTSGGGGRWVLARFLGS